MENVFTKKDPLLDVINQVVLGEKKLTDAELKKREEIAQAIERENPGMVMGKKMAIATAQAKKVAEEVEQIDEADEREVSDKLKRARDYEKVVNSRHNSRAHTKEIQVGVAKDMLDNAHKAVNKTAVAKFLKTRKGDGKVRTEEVEQIDEMDKKSLFGKMKRWKEADNKGWGQAGAALRNRDNPESSKKAVRNSNRYYNLTRGGNKTAGGFPKSTNEEVEQIDELSKGTLGKYISKAVVDVHNDAKWAGETDDRDAKNKAFKRLLGVKSAAARLSKQNVSGGRISNFRREEVDLEEQLENFWGAYLTCLDEAKDDASQQALLLRAMAKDPSDLMKMKRAIAMGDKALTNPVMRQEILKMLDQMMNLTVTDKALLQKTRSSFMKQKQFKAVDTTNTEEYVPEEVEELDEANIPVHHVNKAVSKVLGTKGAVRFAMHHRPGTDKHTSWDKVNSALMKQGVKTKHIADIAAHLKPAQYNEEVEELDERNKENAMRRKMMDASRGARYKLANKVVPDREPEHKTAQAHNKAIGRALRNEEVEELDELSKGTLGNYIKKAATGMNGMAVHAHMSGSASSAEQREKHFDKAFKRGKGIAKAADKLTKEDAMVVYEERRPPEGMSDAVSEESQYAWKIEGGSGKGKEFGHKNTTVDDHLSAMKHHSAEYRKAMDDKRDADARHHGMKYHKHKDQIERLGTVGEYRKEEVEQIDELSKGTLGSYVKKATSDVVNKAVGYSHDAAKVSSKAPPTRTDSDYDKLRVGERGLAKRRKGIDLAVKKLTKEEAEQVDEAGYDFTHYRKMQYAQTRAAQKADDKPPFEGGREVKSSKPAAERVKKIAKGMQKKYTKKD